MTSRATTLPSDPSARTRLLHRLERLALGFQVGVLEHRAHETPHDLEVLVNLAQGYARLGAHDRGLSVDRRLVAARPQEPTFRYNLACSLALTGDLAGACQELLAAIEHGYRDFGHLIADNDLAGLRADGRFALVAERMAASGWRAPRR